MFLLLCLFFCHFLADFTILSRPYMLKAKLTGEPIEPILLHGLIHGILMGIVVSLFGYTGMDVVWVILFQGCTHTLIDSLKGKLYVWFPSLKDTSKYRHWTIFGLDQYLHQLVILVIAYKLNLIQLIV